MAPITIREVLKIRTTLTGELACRPESAESGCATAPSGSPRMQDRPHTYPCRKSYPRCLYAL